MVEPVEGGSRITLTRAPRGANPEWEAYYDDVTEGWTTFLNQLRFAVERHPGEARRTLFYSGTGAVSPIGRAGHLRRPGRRAYELELVGEQVKGEVWYTSEHQVGLTVDAWGNGLLVLSHIPPGDQKPDGATMAILTCTATPTATSSTPAGARGGSRATREAQTSAAEPVGSRRG